MYRAVGIHCITSEYLPCDTHESVPTQQRERMVVDPEAVIIVVRAPDDGWQHPKHVELPTEM